MIVETLANFVIDSDKKEVRDINSLAIRSTIQELKENSAINMIRAVYPKLSKGLKSGSEEVQEECLEILAEIFKKFGSLLYKQKQLINKDELMLQMTELLRLSSEGVRKKATNCVGQFSIILSTN